MIGFLTGAVLSTGPLSVRAFTAYGLVKRVFLATEAASSLFLYVTKVLTFHELGAMLLSVFLQGLLVGSSLMAGTFVGKMVALRMSERTFQHLLDLLLFCSGVSLLWVALS